MAVRNSDRYVTPGVITAVILVAGLLAAVVVGGVTYLTAMGRDPAPVVDLVAKIVTAVGSLGTLALQLVGRATAAKTERNTGQLVGVVADHLTAAAAAPAPAPAPAAAAPRVDDLAGLPLDDYTAEQPRVPVPAIPSYPRHTRTRNQGDY